jgi:hypothetical protein
VKLFLFYYCLLSFFVFFLSSRFSVFCLIACCLKLIVLSFHAFLLFHGLVDVGRAQNQDNKSNGDTFVLDMGVGMPFRSGMFLSRILLIYFVNYRSFLVLFLFLICHFEMDS